MAKKRKPSAQKVIKYLPFYMVLAIALVGIVFALLDSLDLLAYNEITAFFGLSDKSVSENAEAAVHFIDVGQGDCTLIVSGGMTALIDAGEMQNGEKICNYLKAEGIERLDYVIATHPHSDHIGGLAKVIEAFEVGKIIFPEIPDELLPTTEMYKNLLLAIQAKGMKITAAVPDEEYDLGWSKLKILGPVSMENTSLNDYSVVCKLIHGNNSFLFMGDAEMPEENDLIKADLKADVLKTGHHGSNTSSKEDFLKKVSPEYCVIMVGTENSYNHPSEKAIKRMTEYTDKIYRTDLLGTIVVRSDGYNYDFTFEKGN